MKRKAVGFIFALLMLAVFLYGCGGGGGHSNPAASNNTGLARVSGKIVDSAKKPVADVKVRLALTSNSLVNSLPNEIKNTLRLSTTDNSTEFTTTTDKDGQYRFENVPYGRYSLSARASDNGSGVLQYVNISETDTTLSDEPLKPFGFVTGKVTDGKNAIYGARVYISNDEGDPITEVNGTVNGLTSFTNSEGAFTLSYIPIGTQYSFTASLEGYEPVTTPFTISATETELIHNCKPIKLNPNSSEAQYTVTASISGITNEDLPVYVIAQRADNIIYFSKITNLDTSKTITDSIINLQKSGTYNIFAVSSSNKTTKVENKTIDDSNKNVSVGLAFSDEGLKVNIVKVDIEKYIGNSTIDTNHSYDTYFDGNISCYSPSDGWFYKDITNSSSDWSTVRNSEIFYDSKNENNPILCGNSVAFFKEIDGTLENSGYRIYWQIADGSSNAMSLINEKKQFDGDDRYVTPYISGISLIPGEFMCVSYNYLDPELSYFRVGLKAYAFNSSSSQSSGEQAIEPVLYKSLVNDVNDESKIVNDIRMAKDKDGNSYLAALCSEEGLKIYNLSSSDTTINPFVTNTNVETWKFNNFQVYKDGSGNLLFYIEGNNDNIAQTYIIDSSSTIVFSDTESNKKSCYIDNNGCMYQYVPTDENSVNDDSCKIIKTTSPFVENQRLATTTLDLVEGSLKNENINGILGYDENSSTNTLTIFVY